jgi:hypothetical protein
MGCRRSGGGSPRCLRASKGSQAGEHAWFRPFPSSDASRGRDGELETEGIARIRVPTLGAMPRVQGWLVITRNAALADKVGPGLGVVPPDGLYPRRAGRRPCGSGSGSWLSRGHS